MANINGTSGDDSLTGTAGDDSITGQAGNDTIRSGSGNDTVEGGDGNDLLNGQVGDDSVVGGDGNDSVVGGDGQDTLIGGAGDDRLGGQGGDDLLTGGSGNDYFARHLNQGNDTITDFDTTGSGDGDSTNNDFIQLGEFYDSLDELRADFNDDGLLNQSNAFDDEGKAVDYSDNFQFTSGESILVQGATASSFTYDNTGIVCFVEGTLIATPDGPVPVEDLGPGDMVLTRDAGPRAIRWAGVDHLDRHDLAKSEAVRPILIPCGTLGAQRDLLVSRQHGILLGNRGFARAGHLVDYVTGVRVARGKRLVSYHHLLLARHHIILAEGVACESFFPGMMALRALCSDDREDVFSIVPGLADCRNNAHVRRVFGHAAARYLKRQRVAPSYRLWLRTGGHDLGRRRASLAA